MDILELYKDYGIHAQTEGHKHCREGWVNTECPFCTGNPGLHLGATLDGSRFSCWRCGGKHPNEALSKLLGANKAELYKIINQYGGKSRARSQDDKIKVGMKGFKFPDGTMNLMPMHEKYLIKRNFDPDRLSRQWRLKGTGPFGQLDNIDYAYRIIIPIEWDQKIVSFQGRDIKGKSKLRYLACPKKREIVEHQTILYGKQKEWTDTGICVEGVTDVWRFGPKSFATFGIDYTKAQFNLIAKLFKRVIIIFDDDPQAIVQANKLRLELQIRGVEAIVETIIGDPASMKQDDANHLVKSIL
jgi:hypothetical protein